MNVILMSFYSVGILEKKKISINAINGHIILMLGNGKYFNSMEFHPQHSNVSIKLFGYLEIKWTPVQCLRSVNVSDNCFALYILTTATNPFETSVKNNLHKKEEVKSAASCGNIVIWSTVPGTKRNLPPPKRCKNDIAITKCKLLPRLFFLAKSS